MPGMLGYSLRPVLFNDGEQEKPCHPSSNAHHYNTFMSVNREFQKFNTCGVNSVSGGQMILDIL